MLEYPERIKGFIGIASAPDFTRDIEDALTPEQKNLLVKYGRIEIPNDYSENPYVFTRDLLEDGLSQCVLNEKHSIAVPVTLLQGKQDADVLWQKALKIKDCFAGPNTDIIFIEDGDHRLSRPQDLVLIDENIRKFF